MRMNSLLSILIGGFSITSYAFPIGAGKGASSVNCNQNGYEKSFSEMVQKVAIIGDMSIKSFDKSYAEYGITPEEARQIHDASGEVTCTFEGQTSPSVSNAWLIGSNQEVTVNLHLFRDEKNKAYSSFKGCQFTSFAHPNTPFELDFDKTPPDHFRNRLALSDSPREDWVRIRLKNPVPKIKALEPDRSDSKINKDDSFLMVSRRPSGMAPYQASNQLTIQSCSAKKVFPSPSKSTGLYLDCDTFRGMSGALMFKRRDDGVLVPKVFLQGANEDVGNGQPWNEFANTAKAVVLDKGFLSSYDLISPDKSTDSAAPKIN